MNRYLEKVAKEKKKKYDKDSPLSFAGTGAKVGAGIYGTTGAVGGTILGSQVSKEGIDSIAKGVNEVRGKGAPKKGGLASKLKKMKPKGRAAALGAMGAAGGTALGAAGGGQLGSWFKRKATKENSNMTKKEREEFNRKATLARRGAVIGSFAPGGVAASGLGTVAGHYIGKDMGSKPKKGS